MDRGKKMEHINHALVAKTHTPMYLMHKYWARKPHNVVAEYIKHYTKEGDIVLDPFCGSGVTAIEALKLGRKAIAIDLDPMAIFITRMTAMRVDLDEFKRTFKKIEKNVKDQINELYKTKCRNCGNDVPITHVIWEKHNDNEIPIEIWYKCPLCGDRKFQQRNLNTEDINLINEIKKKKIPYWYPTNKLIWNSRINVSKNTKVSDLFTKRALIALSILLHEIESIEEKDIKELFKFVFTSSLAGSSKLIPVVHGGRECKSWTIRGYWMPPKHFEINIWNSFENRYKKVLRGKENSNKEIEYYMEVSNFEDLKNNGNILLLNQSATNLENLPSEIADYIFTDPPYGDSVPYLELDYMWSSWLKFNVNFEDEIIISDSPERTKNFKFYEKMLNLAFKQIFRLLKPEKYMTVTFHNTSIKIWNSLIKAVILAGFDLEKIIYQPPARASAKSLLHPYGSAVGDYYLRFKKPKKIKSFVTERDLDKERYERIVVETAKKLIAERGEPTPYQFILNGIIPELDKNGVLLRGDKGIEEVMKEHLKDEFTLVEVKNEKGKIIGHKWWLKDPSSIPYLEIVPLNERIEKAVINVLNRKIKASFDDIQQEILISFPNALTPDTESIKAILEEYAIKTRDRKWKLKQTLREMQSIHTKMIYYLAKIGKKLGFKIYVGQREQTEEFRGVKLSELCSEDSPTLRFTPLEKLERIKQIDVIWYKDGEVKYEFEVENTTSITEAIVRGSNILTETTKRFIVIPKERENLLYKRLQEPIFSEKSKRDKWNFMFYNDVEELFFMKKIKIEDINKIKRIPRLKTEEQKTLIDYS